MDIGIHMEGSMGKLAHKVAVVTGASKGIGAYDKEITALLVIDPYNDFISEGGKAWGRIRAVAEANSCVPHMLQVLHAAREAQLRVFYAMHHRYRPGDYETWKYIAPVQKLAWANKTFEYGTWGGEMHPGFKPKAGEIVATEGTSPRFWSGFHANFRVG
jgi:ureidoacrylate peracid hydrolase